MRMLAAAANDSGNGGSYRRSLVEVFRRFYQRRVAVSVAQIGGPTGLPLIS